MNIFDYIFDYIFEYIFKLFLNNIINYSFSSPTAKFNNFSY